jgi:uncharacterized protein (DUF488 family)
MKPPPSGSSSLTDHINGMALPFFTIGHSTRSIGDFVELLTASGIGVVADVRTVPRSRTNPQFNRDTLPASLSDYQIGYEHIAELGGLRPRSHDVAPAVNGFWQNQSFHNYADYALGDGFRAGLARLRALGGARRCAIMCAETVWWRCHRRIIADYLLAGDEQVFHILGPGKVAPASLTPGAHAQVNGTLTYPAPVAEPAGQAL